MRRLLYFFILLCCLPLVHAQDTAGEIRQEQGDTPGKPEVEVKYELHKRLDTTAQGEKFSLLSRKKATLRNDVLTLARLLQEKQAELKRMNVRLESNFPVDLSKDYRFDLESKKLFEMKKVGEGDEARVEETEIALFKNEGEQQAFVRLLTSKRLTQVTISSLKLLEREKRMELKAVNDVLLAEFNILSDKNYLYHAKSNVIFLIKPVVTD